jgi:hypothetical protein
MRFVSANAVDVSSVFSVQLDFDSAVQATQNARGLLPTVVMSLCHFAFLEKFVENSEFRKPDQRLVAFFAVRPRVTHP